MKRYPFAKNNAAARQRHAGFVAEQIRQLPIGSDWVVEIKAETKSRTGRQNRYMHAMLGEIAKAIGMTADDAKDALVLKFLGTASEREVGGVTLVQRVRTSKLNTKQCAEFCDRIREWAAQFLGLLLPLPEEFGEGWSE